MADPEHNTESLSAKFTAWGLRTGMKTRIPPQAMYRKMPAAACKLTFGRVVRTIYHVSNQEEIPTMVDYMMQVWRMPGTFEYSIYQITA